MEVGMWSFIHTPYNKTEVCEYAPKRAGLYTLWVKYKNGKWVCYYVGKADNIESQLLDHLSKNEKNPCIKKYVKYKCAFCYIKIKSEAERSGAEKYLYDMMKPECNKKDPGGITHLIPLPPKP